MKSVSLNKYGLKIRRVVLGSLAFLIFAPRLEATSVAPARNFEKPASALAENGFAPQVRLPVTITLRERVTVSDARVFFDNVGSCRGSQSICEELASVDLGEAPKPGSHKSFDRAFITQVLAVEFEHVDFVFEGAARVTINGDFQELTHELLRSYYFDALSKSLEGMKNIRIDHVQVRLSRPIKVLPGDFKLSFPILEEAHPERLEWVSSHFVGNHSIQVVYEPSLEAVGADKKTQEFAISTQVSLSLQVPVVKFEIPRGGVVEHANLEYQWVAMRQQSLDFIQEISEAVGLRATQAVKPGQPISKRQLAAPVLVKRGEVVSLLLRRGEMVIRGQAKALSSGVKGQNIPVVYPSTKKQIQGRIVDQGQVEVL